MDFAQQLNHHPNGSEDDDAAEWKQVAELRAVAEAQDPACKVRPRIPSLLPSPALQPAFISSGLELTNHRLQMQLHVPQITSPFMSTLFIGKTRIIKPVITEAVTSSTLRNFVAHLIKE
jgi:hypothetical protein